MGLLAYWLCEEATGATRVDGSGNGYDLDDAGAADVTQEADSEYGTYSAGFDGTTENAALHIDDASCASTWPGKNGGSGTDFTMYFHAKIDTIETYDRIWTKELCYEAFLSASTNKLCMQLYDSGGTGRSIYTNALSTATWYAFVMRWQGSTDDEYSAWVDGGKLGTTHTITAVKLNANEYVLGAYRDNGYREFIGKIDEAAVWDTALSDADIGTLSSGGITAFLTPPAAGIRAGYYDDHMLGGARLIG